MEQPSKPAAEERHDARRHISPQLDQAVRRGAGRTTSPNTTAPMSPIHYTSTRCSCLWTGPNPLWTPASRWRFTSTQAKLQKPCWTPRQHDTKPQTSQKKHNTVLVPTNTEAAAHSGQTVPTAAQVQHVLSKAVHPLLVQPSHKSPEPFTITKRQTAARLRRLKPQCLLRPPAHSVSTPTFSKQAGTTCRLKSRRSLIQTEQMIPNAPLNVTCICVKHGLSGWW